MQLRILGPVQMNLHGKSVDIGATKVRGLLGVLAYRSNEPVAVGYLSDALWDEDRPPDPAKTLPIYVSRLRRALEGTDLVEVLREHGTYRLRIDPSTVDYHDFLEKKRTAHRAYGRGDHATAADMFAAAVNLWRGPLLADLTTSWARRQQESLVMLELLPTQCALFDAKLALGEHDFVLDALPSLLADHPDDERLAGVWMRALKAANRSQDLPPFFRGFCQRLRDEQGVGPDPELVAIYQNATGTGSTDPFARPAQVPEPPRATPHFTGRGDLLRRLDELLAGPEPAVMLVALDGQPGVGKTTLVLHWARRRQSGFPDGILYLDLGGYSTANPVEPGMALAELLDMLGTPPDRVPASTEGRAALLRQTLTGRRVLVILDNVRDSAHVRPILPGTADCPTVITSRRQLSGVAFRGSAERIILPRLTADEATELLEARIGRRPAADLVAVGELVALCDRNPLALWIASEHVAGRPAVPIGDHVDELRETRRLLDIGSHGDDESTTLRSTYTLSYRTLKPAQARLFRLLGLLPGTRFSVGAASAVSSVDRPAVDHLLDALVAAHLVEQERAGRYRIHDLLHQYAADSAKADEPAEDRDTTMRRLLTWYVRSACNARVFLTSDPHQVPELPAAEPVAPLEFDDPDEARRWFALERASLVTLVHRAAEQGHHEHVWRLAACLNEVNTHGHLHELLAVHERGAESAALAGQQAASAGCLNNMGQIYQLLDDALRAGRCFEQAYHGFQASGDVYGEAVSLHNIGTTHLMLGNPAEAISAHRRALDLLSAANAEWPTANVHSRLGDAYRRLDRFEEASSHYLRAWHIAQKHGDQRSQGAALNRLARLHLDMDRPKDAIDYGLTALDTHDRTGDRGGAAEVLCTLAMARIELQAPSQAATDAMEAVRTHREMGNVSGETSSLGILADALEAAGEDDLARETRDQISELLDSPNAPRAGAADDHVRRPDQPVRIPRPAGPMTTRPRVTRSDYAADA